jgi:putative transposase
MKKRHTEVQIITILREAESGATPVKMLCKRHNISDRRSFGGVTSSAGWKCLMRGG